MIVKIAKEMFKTEGRFWLLYLQQTRFFFVQEGGFQTDISTFEDGFACSAKETL